MYHLKKEFDAKTLEEVSQVISFFIPQVFSGI